MQPIKTFDGLEKLGRQRLSDNFYMRDFLYSEIANFYGIPNIPEDPELAIQAGTQLCQHLLEPLHQRFGSVVIRSSYRSPAVNHMGNELKHNCSTNDRTRACHIWDQRDKEGNMGATACIFMPRFADMYNQGDACWTELAWWIHDHLPYNTQYFFPKNAALNLNWRENPIRRIDSYIVPKGTLTKPGMDNHEGDHADAYPNLRQI